MDDTGSHTLFDFSNFIYALLPKGYFAKIHPPSRILFVEKIGKLTVEN